MIVKKNFNPLKVFSYVWQEMLYTAVFCVMAWWMINILHLEMARISFSPLAVLGTALAIFLGFRNNSAYARWWEARAIWGNIISSCRVFGRQVLSGVSNAREFGKGGDPESLREYGREMLYRQAAFVHALRLHLRKQTDWESIMPLLPREEYSALMGFDNKPNMLLLWQSSRLKDGVREEKLGTFDPISLEPNLAALNNFQSACERIKNTPLPRHYDYFTRLFLWVFFLLLPFAMLSLATSSYMQWTSMILTMITAFVFAIVNKTGSVLENPFENSINDIPMMDLCIRVERDLREMLEERTLPELKSPEKGYLY